MRLAKRTYEGITLSPLRVQAALHESSTASLYTRYAREGAKK